MPEISLINVPLYQPLDPYHHVADNVPLEGLIDRLTAINNAVDNQELILGESIGTAGSLANRLAQSINPDGSIKSEAIDNALHSIEEHLDNGSFVRMTVPERAKLSLVAGNATALQVLISTISGVIPFENDTLQLAGSDSVQWEYASGRITANSAFPATVRHVHHYGLTPVHQNLITPNYTDYYVTSLATAYREGSLRVYVNGIRLDPNGTTYVPIGMPSTVSYLGLTYTEDGATSGVVTSGGFSLSTAITVSARILVDFDVLYS